MTTRAALLQDLNAWTGRDDLTVDPTAGSILRIAQSTMDRSVRLRAQEQASDLVCTSRRTALPEGFLAFRSVTIDSSIDRRIEQMSPEQIRASGVWTNQNYRGENTPANAYSLEGGEIVLAPAPSVDNPTTLNLVYYAKLPALIAPTDTNTLLTMHYDLYLWAVLTAAAVFLEDMELERLYDAKFNRTLEDVVKNERRARFSGSGLRPTGNVRHIV